MYTRYNDTLTAFSSSLPTSWYPKDEYCDKTVVAKDAFIQSDLQYIHL